MFFFQGGDEIVSKKLRAGVVANALRWAISLICIYFLYRNIIKWYQYRQHYLKDSWSFIDFLLFVTVLIGMWFDYYQMKSTSFSGGVYMQYLLTYYSISALIMWIKLIYFARIFQVTGTFVHMVSAIVKDMWLFMVFMAITQMAFTHAFYLGLESDVVNPTVDACAVTTDTTTRFLQTDDLAGDVTNSLGGVDTAAYKEPLGGPINQFGLVNFLN